MRDRPELSYTKAKNHKRTFTTIFFILIMNIKRFTISLKYHVKYMHTEH